MCEEETGAFTEGEKNATKACSAEQERREVSSTVIKPCVIECKWLAERHTFLA